MLLTNSVSVFRVLSAILYPLSLSGCQRHFRDLVLIASMDYRYSMSSVSVDLPRSIMLYTPAALELALRCPLTMPLSSGGDDDKPEMAESTLVRGSTVSADIVAE